SAQRAGSSMKRRSLLLSGAAAAGALLVGWSVLPPRSRLGSAELWPPVSGEVALNGWIKIASDGTVVLAMNRSEMGQGVHTALAMLVADELDVPLARVHFGQLAEQAALSPPGDVTLKPSSSFRVIGRPAVRIDAGDKSDGRALFGLDMRPLGLVYAALAQAPMLGGSPASVDSDAVLKRTGVERVVRLPPLYGAGAAVAVVARTTWHAREALAALPVIWRAPPSGLLDSKRIEASLESAARDAAERRGGFAFVSAGDSAAALAGAARRVEALYRAPYLAHATME